MDPAEPSNLPPGRVHRTSSTDGGRQAESESKAAPRSAAGSTGQGTAPLATGGSGRIERAQRFVPRHKVLRLALPLVLAMVLGVLLGAAFAATIDIPEVESITELDLGLVTVLEASDGEPFQRYYLQRRVLLKPEEIPPLLRGALLAAEDSHFYQHGGVDLLGVLSTVVDNVLRSERRGASTLTMQLAGSVFLDRSQRTWERKIREAFHAVELEKTLSKEQILTLYCNWVNLGHRNYGFEAAANYYFDKSVGELDAAETATLVAIVPRPSVWSPIRKADFMTGRRNLVLSRMLSEGVIDQAVYERSIAQPLETVERVEETPAGAYFSEAVRRRLFEKYGEKGLNERGLQVRTTFEPRIQAAVDDSLRAGLIEIDRATRGWRGATLQLSEEEIASKELPSWANLRWEDGRWVEAIVTQAGRSTATLRIADQLLRITSEAVAWTRKARVDQVLSVGDVAWFELSLSGQPAERGVRSRSANPVAELAGDLPPTTDAAAALGGAPAEEFSALDFELELMQEPEIEGAVVVLENATGAIRALGGGWDFDRSEFNRAMQAKRQPGSAFKPFVFGAAYEMGYTPADTLFDAPAVFPSGDGSLTYSPRNFYRNYEGIITLRRALEKSINVTAVKLQDLVGVQRVIEFARRSGIESQLPPYPSLALGSAELTPIELAAAYAAIANEGTYLQPYLIEHVETPEGRVLERHQPSAARAMDPAVAYLLTHTMRGVIERGTATAAKKLGLAAAGKTGTTDGYTDAWFAGFTPELTVVTWVGYDRKRRIGRGMTGARAALPIWTGILERGVEEGWVQPASRREFTPPPGIIFRSIEPNTGLLSNAMAPTALKEAFLVGTEPVQEYAQKWERILALPWYQQRRFYGKPKDGERMPEDIEDWSAVLSRRQGN